jgi:hypothetical protein
MLLQFCLKYCLIWTLLFTTAFIFLAYFPEIKVGLSSVCVCVCLSLCHLPIPVNWLVDFYEIPLAGYDCQGDLEALIFNPTASTILKYWFSNLCGGCITCTIQSCSTMGWDCLALLGFHSYVTHTVCNLCRACTLPKAVKLYYIK